MKIPWESLPGETLDTLLEEIVTRDGTDYGDVEKSTSQKLTYARNQLKAGYAILYWDAELESASLLTPQQVQLVESSESEVDAIGQDNMVSTDSI